jgi:hypothetical protein
MFFLFAKINRKNGSFDVYADKPTDFMQDWASGF